MARAAKAAGGEQSLWPKGMSSAQEIPYDLFLAISHAFTILSWRENLKQEEVPPEWMWPFDSELNEWFDAVNKAREEEYGGGDGGSGNMMQNEYAKERFGSNAL